MGFGAASAPAMLASVLVILMLGPVEAEPTTSIDVPMDDDPIIGFFQADQFEYRNLDGDDVLRWDGFGWIGRDYHRLWLRADGEYAMSTGDTRAELQFLYGYLVAPFWEIQAGLRYDREFIPGEDDDLGFAVIGIDGLAPYRIETAAALFVSDEGDAFARVELHREILVTQRIVAQLRFESNLASGDVRSFDQTSGINNVELGLRVRYEIKPEFAPYVGVSWDSKVGNTADLVRRGGRYASIWMLVAGFRFWF